METPLEVCERHVAEGHVRIRRQLDLIYALEKAGNVGMLHQARLVLGEVMGFQRAAEEQLERERLRKAE
ncbi:hypothetical protein GXW78_16010 [Roseomonas terrae]|uniref:Uncharacterized protein n=1 Tax=Neoroseomonas terrae TaxID=424799 RepID=A0ABS5EJH3_9PROT|nr:hypothetical protein [Neoroseomonas terrae]MBR0651178.1 hypothetical protein [Neoroseomonas terrae]